jgi:probable HAF family extracellular repeat protein
VKTCARITFVSSLLSLKLFGASFQGLGDLPGGAFSSAAYAVSADGKVVVGGSVSSNGTEGFRWTKETGMVGLGDLPGGSFYSYAFGVSGDGSVVVRQSSSALGFEAFRWTTTNRMVGLGDLAGGSYSSVAWGVSADGRVIVGESSSALSPDDETFRWTATNGMVGLGLLAGSNRLSVAYTASADGSVIVGYSYSSNATSGYSEAFRWTQATGTVGLGDLPGGITNSIAYAVSADGSIIVGRGISYTDTHGISTEQAFSWTAQGGIAPLGFIPCDTWSIAHAVSADGSIIVGDPYQGSGDCVFIWDAQHGIRNLHAVLVALGLNLTGWQLSEAHGVSSDGRIIVGYGTDPAGKTEGWIADLTPPVLAVRARQANLILSWPTNTAGFTLQSAPGLNPPVDWTDWTSPPAIVGAEFSVTNQALEGARFYRLKK